MKTSILTLLFTSILVSSSAAFAQQDDRDAEARAIFDAGVIAYDAGRFDSALANFERALELSGRPELYYNIGLAAERLRRDDRAVEAYERYLAEVPDGRQRGSVQARLDVLRAAITEREAHAARLREAELRAGSGTGTNTHAASTTESASETKAARSTTRIVLLASGGALLAGAAAGGGLWAVEAKELDRCRGADPASSVCTNESALESRRNFGVGLTVATATAGIGLLVTGLLVGRHHGADADARTASCAPTLGGLVCAGTF